MVVEAEFMAVALILVVPILWSAYWALKRWEVKNSELWVLNLAAVLTFIISYLSIGMGIDTWMNSNIEFLKSPFLTQILDFLSRAFSTPSMTITTAVFIGVLLYAREKDLAKLVFFSMSLTSITQLTIKHMVGRARPNPIDLLLGAPSFPSGHAAAAIVFFSLAVYVFRDSIQSITKRKFFVAGMFLLTFIIGFSRIYLKVHWFTDVTAGYAVGMFWFSLLVIASNSGRFRWLGWTDQETAEELKGKIQKKASD